MPRHLHSAVATTALSHFTPTTGLAFIGPGASLSSNHHLRGDSTVFADELLNSVAFLRNRLSWGAIRCWSVVRRGLIDLSEPEAFTSYDESASACLNAALGVDMAAAPPTHRQTVSDRQQVQRKQRWWAPITGIPAVPNVIVLVGGASSLITLLSIRPLAGDMPGSFWRGPASHGCIRTTSATARWLFRARLWARPGEFALNR